jgi:DNA-directed RNA polymerase specialized sigma24 family protein
MTKGTQTASWIGEHSAAIDLRRSVDDRTADRIVARADWLPEPDRSMVLAVFGEGLPAAAAARLRSEEPRLVRRRVAKAAARVLDARAPYVAARAGAWPPARARVARAIFHHGCTLRETARLVGISLYTVRVHRDAIEGMFESERAQHQRTSKPAAGVDRSWQ